MGGATTAETSGVTDGRRRATEDELVAWLDSLSNWGRWGPDDERGTLNFIDPGRTQAATRAVTSGTVVSCSIPITFGRRPHAVTGRSGTKEAWKVAPMQFMIKGGEDSTPDKAEQVYGSDAFLIAPHGSMVTHLDTPSHILFKGTMFNGKPATALSMDGGAAAGSVELARDGIVTRGVLLDVARSQGRDWLDDGEEIFPEDLEAAERHQGVRVERGDALLVRTGYRKRNPLGPATDRPGLQATCLPWLREREVAMLGTDVTQDVHPHGYRVGSPVHLVGIWALGLWLLDNCDLERLGAACSDRSRWDFLFVLAPLVLRGGTGSPVNPLAVL